MSALHRKPRNSSSKVPKRSSRHLPDDARREIMDCAIQFLRRHPVRDLTIGELMEGTTLSRPAFYQYFDDLHHLIESLLHEVETVMHETANPWIHGEGEPVNALRKALEGVVQTCVDHGPIIRAVSEAAPLDERLEQAWSDFMGRWDGAVEMRIKAHQNDGLIATNLDANRTANALNALDAAVLIAQFGREAQGDPKSVLNTLHHIWTATLYGPQ